MATSFTTRIHRPYYSVLFTISRIRIRQLPNLFYGAPTPLLTSSSHDKKSSFEGSDAGELDKGAATAALSGGGGGIWGEVMRFVDGGKTRALRKRSIWSSSSYTLKKMEIHGRFWLRKPLMGRRRDEFGMSGGRRWKGLI
ncbi:hypothetical protein L6452_20107 [Arctium lappa]|uniref:Uncharacterized protein n=1 Tax=Arctium lappa TaxID=4217 RepID=A0ACB9B9P2_ARCLA|nr:hypothetical protein L6452_20107 [Arctium lappa]